LLLDNCRNIPEETKLKKQGPHYRRGRGGGGGPPPPPPPPPKRSIGGVRKGKDRGNNKKKIKFYIWFC